MLVSVSIGLQLALLYRVFPSFNVKAEPAAQRAATSLQPDPHNVLIGTVLDLAGLPTEGTDAARIGLIEFTDYECPFCAQHARTVSVTLREKFVKPGKIRYAIANVPLPNHANAKLLAVSAICAGQQDRYRAMHDELFRAVPKTRDDVLALAHSLNLKTDTFSRCLADQRVLEGVDRDLQRAQAIGVQATPTFLIGPVTEEGQIRVNSVIMGAQPIAVFEAAIRKEEMANLAQ